MKLTCMSAFGLMLLSAVPALGAETITYSYDAKGWLVKVVRTGTVNNNVTVEYTHDKTDNRTRVKTTNSLTHRPDEPAYLRAVHFDGKNGGMNVFFR